MQITLKVENLSVKLTEPPRQVLDSICGHVKPGQILAVMGPSGSGKTTLLSALSGRIKSSGKILLNGTQLNKTLRRQICYVLQNDVFFSNLTLRQTLVYAAMLRLPDSMSHEHKMRQVDQVIDALDLKSCQDTVIGDYMRRGLSGGEKKRCSIACELLSNPAVMMLDEPTSSLDSCTALSLIKLLKEYAIKEQKTIIISIHQPSSQIFYLFDKLLLLSQGQMIYFGSIQQVLPYFQHFNYHMQHLSYNPADFVMEIIKSVDDKERNRLSHEARECYFSFYKRNSIENNMSPLGSSGTSSPNNGKSVDGHQLQHQFVAPQDSVTGKQEDLSSSIHSSWSKIYIYDNHDDAYSFDDDYLDQCCQENKWPSSFMTQLYALTSRNFIDGKARMLSKLNWVQTIGLAIIAGAIWFQIKRSEETLTDIKGWMYFSTMYWMMFALFNAITSFPSECQVINKERLAGSYRLSSYYVAKMIGELPLVIALPSAFHLISYPLLGYHSFYTFVSLWGFAILKHLLALFSLSECFLPGLRTSLSKPWPYSIISSVLNILLLAASCYQSANIGQFLFLLNAFTEPDVQAAPWWPLVPLELRKNEKEIKTTVTANGPVKCLNANYNSPDKLEEACCEIRMKWSALVAQSVGMFIGFTFSSLELSITIAALYSTATMLFGGFYANTIPVWLNWLRYGSIVYYGYLNMQMVEFGTGPPISCAIKNSKYSSCINDEHHQTINATDTNELLQHGRHQNRFISTEDILIGLDPIKGNEQPNPIWVNTLCLVGFFLFFRILGYAVLRIYHKPS